MARVVRQRFAKPTKAGATPVGAFILSMKPRYYAGIGSRKTPDNVLNGMESIAEILQRKGYILRSGGAAGADSAFANGAEDFQVFHGHDATEDAMHLASRYHPNWEACSDYVRALHGRNMQIVLGYTLDTPVNFIVCWTPDAQLVGGTAQALRLAKDFAIPVFNLANQEHWWCLNESIT